MQDAFPWSIINTKLRDCISILVFWHCMFFCWCVCRCQVLGTYGYAAPEYVETGHLTSQSDIWSFGVVLYEILTGRRTVERNRPAAEQKLLYWVKQFPVDSSRFSMIIDPRLRNEYSIKAARQIAKLADSCLNKNAKERPAMTQVVASLKQIIQDLEGGSTSTNKNIAESSQSSLFRRRQNKVCPCIIFNSLARAKTLPYFSDWTTFCNFDRCKCLETMHNGWNY